MRLAGDTEDRVVLVMAAPEVGFMEALAAASTAVPEGDCMAALVAGSMEAPEGECTAAPEAGSMEALAAASTAVPAAVSTAGHHNLMDQVIEALGGHALQGFSGSVGWRHIADVDRAELGGS
jgi:hypothetical protein